jgi:branched-chain amino acid transport system substrate-binding protein
LPLYSSPTLHTYQTLEQGPAIAGLTLVTPWQYPQTAEPDTFADRARRLWGGQVSWRTAMSYDAAIAISTGLQQSDGTRQGLQQALQRSNFSAVGASGTVKFLSTGDRQSQPAIVSVQQLDGKWVFATPRSQL